MPELKWAVLPGRRVQHVVKVWADGKPRFPCGNSGDWSKADVRDEPWPIEHYSICGHKYCTEQGAAMLQKREPVDPLEMAAARETLLQMGDDLGAHANGDERR